jgi:mono/diheme cytochrome c family protein
VNRQVEQAKMRATGHVARRLIVVVWVAFAGQLVAQTDRVRERDPSWTAPKDADQSNPLAGRANILAGGQKVYGQRCHTCHGREGRGTTRAPSLVAADVQAQTDGALFWKITGGNTRAGMPSFSFLPEAQRWQLVLHLRGLAKEVDSAIKN